MRLLVFEVLDGAQALEGAVDHDGQTSAEGLTLLHAGTTRIWFRIEIKYIRHNAGTTKDSVCY